MKEEELRLSVDNNEVSLINSSKHEPHKRNIPAISIDNKSNAKDELNKKIFSLNKVTTIIPTIVKKMIPIQMSGKRETSRI